MSRKVDALRLRWHNNLNPKFKYKDWTEQEEDIMI